MKRWLAASLLLTVIATGAMATQASAATITSFGADWLRKEDGSYWIWGDRRTVPTEIVELTGVKESLGETGFVVKEDGSVWYMLKQFYSLEFEVLPVQTLQDIKQVYSGYGRYLFLSEDGDVYITPEEYHSVPEMLSNIRPLPGITNVTKLSGYVESRDNPYTYDRKWLFLKEDGTVWKGGPDSEGMSMEAALSGAIDLQRNQVLKADGTVWTLPQLLTGDQAAVPAPLEGLRDIQVFHTNHASSTGIDDQGQVWFWGHTVTGALDGTTRHALSTPIHMSSIHNAASAYIVDRALIVLTTEGEVYTTSIGKDTLDGTEPFRLLAEDVRQLEAGREHLVMQKEDGTLWSWGANTRAQLGTGNYEYANESPAPMHRPVTLRLNGEPVSLANGIVIQEGQAFIPLRSVFEKLGATLTWDHPTQTVTIDRVADGKADLRILIDYTTGEVLLNGNPVSLNNTPFIVNGSSYLPLRFISESLGATVEWQDEISQINLGMK